jgi:hypothetical protein
MGPETETFFDEPAFYMGRVKNLGFVIWRVTPTLERVDKVTAKLAKLEQEPGAGFAMLAVVTPTCAPVGPEVRRALDSGLRYYRDAALGFAAVIEVQGVLGGLTRAIARTLSIVSRSPIPINTYATVADAAEWLSQILSNRGGAQLSRQAIIEAVSAQRRSRA